MSLSNGQTHPSSNLSRSAAPHAAEHKSMHIEPPVASPARAMAMAAKRTQEALSMRLLTEREVREITGIPMGTLRRWRCVGEGPPFIKLGSGPKARVRYDAIDILSYVEAGKRYPIRAGNTGGQHGNY